MTRHLRVCREGIWLYDGTIATPVRIIALNWDYGHEPEYDPDPPLLDVDGWAYYVQFGLHERNPPALSHDDQGAFVETARLLELDRFQHPRGGSLSVAGAVAQAEAAAPGGIQWFETDAPAA
jgi:hypothetical protein